MKAAVRKAINRANATHSTGPVTLEGKERSSMNAFQHGLTGNRMILQPHEQDAYQRLTRNLLKDLAPFTEPERQLAQKIIDCHTRLNRIAALESNLLNLSMLEAETGTGPDQPGLADSIAAQCRAWTANENSFDKLGRYEARISRQLLHYSAELERLQQARLAARKRTQPAETKPANPEMASFRQTPLRPAGPVPSPSSRPLVERAALPVLSSKAA